MRRARCRSQTVEPEEWVYADGTRVTIGRAAAPKPANRRRFERITVLKRARVTELDSFDSPGAEFECTIVDISRGGLALCSARMVHLDRRVLIELNGPTEGSSRVLFGIVKQVRYVEGKGCITGIQFEEMPRSAKVESWLAQRRNTD
jgi:hypothetical protein